MLARLGFVASVLGRRSFDEPHLQAAQRGTGAAAETDRRQSGRARPVLDFLERHQITLYRISRNIIPLASHAINAIAWWREYADRFRHLGRRLRARDVRVSTHPGRYTVLNAPAPSSVEAAVSELVYHARLLDGLGTDASSRIVVHAGGLYGESEAVALERFVLQALALPRSVRRRLVVENDDRLFDADDILRACRLHRP